jgi:hypothetical protein
MNSTEHAPRSEASSSSSSSLLGLTPDERAMLEKMLLDLKHSRDAEDTGEESEGPLGCSNSL